MIIFFSSECHQAQHISHLLHRAKILRLITMIMTLKQTRAYNGMPNPGAIWHRWKSEKRQKILMLQDALLRFHSKEITIYYALSFNFSLFLFIDLLHHPGLLQIL